MKASCYTFKHHSLHVGNLKYALNKLNEGARDPITPNKT